MKINIEENSYFAKGTHKKCYLHPGNKELCIKIPYSKEGLIDINREIKYQNILNNINKRPSCMPNYYGTIETNMETGYIFDYIKEKDGSACATLDTFINDLNLFDENISAIINSLQEFKEEYFKYQIVSMDIYPGNLLFQKKEDNSYKVYFINDLGDSSFLHLSYYIEFLRKKKCKRIWNRFITRLDKSIPQVNLLCQKLSDNLY